jgi:hypothetical protein
MKGLVLVLALCTLACQPGEEYPSVRSGSGLRMDGTRRMLFSKVPHTVRMVESPDSGDVWVTAPIPLTAPYTFAAATRLGKIYIFGAGDSLSTVSAITGNSIQDLLADDSTIFYATAGGACGRIGYDGRLQWSFTPDSASVLTANPIIQADALLLPLGQHLVCLQTSTGKPKWTQSTTLPITSLATREEGILVLRTNSQNGATDTAQLLDLRGRVLHSAGFANTRFLSNVCWYAPKNFAAGYLVSTAMQNVARVGLFEIGEKGMVLHWSSSVPYLPINIAADDETIYASGFRFTEGETESGIDAFRFEDTARLWQRRFTEPLAAPVAVGPDALFFPLSIEGESEIPTRALLFSLNSEDGKTLSQRPIRMGTVGARTGVLARMPMPDENGRLLFADRDRLRIWILSD